MIIHSAALLLLTVRLLATQLITMSAEAAEC